MNKEWIEDWREVEKDLMMHGFTSTSKNLDVAMSSSCCDTDYSDDQQAVLFVYSIRNYRGF